MNLRSFHHGDEQLFLDLVNRTYRNLESLTVERVRRLLSQPFFDPRGLFIAEEKGIAVGCIGVFNARARKCLSESGLTTTFTVFLEENGKNQEY
jgi:hypothetical protein